MVGLPDRVAGGQADQPRLHFKLALVQAHVAHQQRGHPELGRDRVTTVPGGLNYAAGLRAEHFQPCDPGEFFS